MAYDAEDRIEVIVDWKNGVDIDAERLNSYRGQLRAYQQHTGASHGGSGQRGDNNEQCNSPSNCAAD